MNQTQRTLNSSLISTLIFFSYSFSFAQKPEIKWGPETDIALYKKTKFVGDNENLFYSYAEQGRVLLINKLSLNESKDANEVRVELPIIRGKESSFFNLVYLDGKLYLFSRVFDKAEGTNAIYANLLNSDGTISAEAKLIDEIKLPKNVIGNSYFELTKNATKLCLNHYEPKYDENPEKYVYKLIDKDLKTIWTKTFEIPLNKEIFYNSFLLDQKDNLALLSIYGKTAKEIKKNDLPYSLSLIYYNHKIAKLSETPLDFQNNYFSAYELDVSRNDKIVFAGTYSDKLSKDNNKNFTIKGLFCFVMNQDGQSLESSQFRNLEQDFPEEKLKNYYLKNIQYASDDRIFLITEQYDTYEVARLNSQASKDRKTAKGDVDAEFLSMKEQVAFYHLFDKIIIGSFSTNQFNWAKQITKFQMVENPGKYSFAGFIAIPNGDNLHLIINKTKSDVESEKPLTSKPALRAAKIMLDPPVTLFYNIDKQGNVTEKKLFSGAESEMAIRCKMAFQIKNKGVIFIGRTETMEKIGTLKYN